MLTLNLVCKGKSYGKHEDTFFVHLINFIC